ncbi:MAG TPA: hypothetical protein VJN70_13030, partial [Gemmatimonadaceae bacterium]|nr:hypothetical protein [Gemmatimonadaceae bacterium]
MGVRLRGPLGIGRDGGVGEGVEEAELFTGFGFWGALGVAAAVAMLASARMRGVITGVGAVAENDGVGAALAGAGGGGTGAAGTGPMAGLTGAFTGTAAKASPIP